MKRIGITGGIGSGKTYVSKIFSSLSVPVFNSDLEAKKLMISSKKLIKLLKDEFGKNIYKDKYLDKDKLSSIVFSNYDKLQKLNSFVHPLVKKVFDNWCRLQKSTYIIKEAAIIFESNSYLDLDAVICVSAPLDLRVKRLLRRDSFIEDDIKKRIDNQISQEDKEKLSDYIILNDEKQLLLPQIIKIHEELLL